MSFADACFDNQRQHDRLENVVLGALYDFMERSAAWIKRLDPYDRSIEFWVSEGAALDESEQAVLWTLGFHRCWIVESKDVHNGIEESNGTERYYCYPEVVGMGNRELKLIRDPACNCGYSLNPHVHLRPEGGPMPKPAPPEGEPCCYEYVPSNKETGPFCPAHPVGEAPAAAPTPETPINWEVGIWSLACSLESGQRYSKTLADMHDAWIEEAIAKVRAAIQQAVAATEEAARLYKLELGKAKRQVCIEPGCSEPAPPYCARHRGDWNR